MIFGWITSCSGSSALLVGPTSACRPSSGYRQSLIVTRKGSVSISGLARAEITEPLTTAQIVALKEEQPEWLRRERATRAEAQRAEARLRAERSGRSREDPVGG